MNNNNYEEQKKIENKAENKKAFKKYVFLIIIGGICGGIVGGLISFGMSYTNMDFTTLVPNAIITINPYFAPVIIIIGGGLMSYYYNRAKKLYRAWDKEDEYHLNDVEMNISKAMLVSTVSSIMVFFGLGVQIYASSLDGVTIQGAINGTVIMIAYLVLCLALVFCQKKIIDFSKIVNPEKKGSVYDKKFQEKWLESCDEAERMNIYQSAYASYKFMNIFLVVLWGITAFSAIAFGVGLYPMALISASWLAMNVVYLLKSMKLEKIKRK